MQSLALALLSLALTASARPQAPPPAASAAPAAPVFLVTQNLMTPGASKIIPVVVGGNQRVFTPNNIVANPGDVIQFQFNTANHSVTQSAAETPCRPLQDAANPNAVNSGFITFNAANNQVNTFNVPVTSAGPMFMYCSQATHCQEGMVMTVNANPEQLIQYANLARTQPATVAAPIVAGGAVASLPLANAVFQPGQVPVAMPPGVITVAPPGASVLPNGAIPPTVTVTTTITPGVAGQPAAAQPTPAAPAAQPIVPVPPPAGAPVLPGVRAGANAEPIVILQPANAAPVPNAGAVPVAAPPGQAPPAAQPIVPVPPPPGSPVLAGVTAGANAEPIVVLNPPVNGGTGQVAAPPGQAPPAAAPINAVPPPPGAPVLPGVSAGANAEPIVVNTPPANAGPIPNSGAVPVLGAPSMIPEPRGRR